MQLTSRNLLPMAGETELKSFNVLKKTGTLAHIFNTGTDMQRVEKGKKGEFPFNYTLTVVQPNAEQLSTVTKYIEASKIKVIIDRVLPLEKARYIITCSCSINSK